jgi:hypothetical protein
MSETKERVYPYLGRNYIEGKAYVVLFTEEEYGIVVMNETQSDTIQFAKLMSFDESQFEVLPPDECVRLSN